MERAVKTYKVRLYPNKAQEVELLKILAGCRFVWNHFLERKQNDYLNKKKLCPYLTLAKELTLLRKTAPELSGMQARPLGQSLRRLEKSYLRFIRKIAEMPHFKTDQSTQSFEKNKDWRLIGGKVSVQNNILLKTRGSLPPREANLGTLVVKLEAGQWFASICVKEDIRPAKRHTKSIGIDVGVKDLAVISTGKKYPSLKPDYLLHEKMRHLKRKMARQEMGSNRREDTRLKIARLYQKMGNIRSNHIHQTTHSILKKNPSIIAIESLNVRGMMRNHKLARSLADVSLGELHRQLKYKQMWNGGVVVEIDRFYPSTKTCSSCGFVKDKMTLATRSWECPRCGVNHDRDINAAKVILQQGLGQLSVEGAGASHEAQPFK